MIKRIAIVLTFALLATAGFSQVTVKLDKSGNYIATQVNADTTGQKTGKKFTDSKGQVYPVYLSATGRLFVVRTSKAGKIYKQYLKLEN